MSHIVTISVEVRDLEAVRAACRRLQFKEPVFGMAKLFRTTAEGWQINLPGWKYPIVCELSEGKILYDNYEGEWGEQIRLNQFLQAYSIEKTSLEARRRGYSVYEQPLSDGSVKLTINLGQGGNV